MYKISSVVHYFYVYIMKVVVIVHRLKEIFKEM
jgi:hypothetical protein